MFSLPVVLLAGLYFVALAAVALTAPARASVFLLGFASSASTHYAELLVRLLVGAAFVAQSARMPFAAVFYAFGWLLLVTTLGLFLVPWQRHRRFAQRAVPLALRHLPLGAFVSLLMGGFVLWSAIRSAT
jgi:hypothetical protein